MQSRVTCLLVDDLEENLLALAALLRQDDVDVLMARSGDEALELLLEHDVALAFLDVQMPDMDGFELAELIRGSVRTRHVPLIFVTAGARDQLRLFQGYETGAVDFLYKPIDPHILKNKASVFFQLYRQKQQLAQELVERTQTLRLNEMFMAVLGHDLRNPLSAIVTSAQVMKHLSGDPQVQQAAERILSSGKWMGRMIEDMLDLARARVGGGIVVTRSLIDLKEVAERVIQEHRTAGKETRIDIDVLGDLRGHWDADRLAQVTTNLIGNALKYGEAGAPVQVVLDGSSRSGVHLAVRNRGAIPPEILPNIFDPFRTSQSSGRRGEGLGLGLYIVQQIVRAHGGQVDIRPGLPDETCVDVRLPRDAAAPC